MKRLRRLPAAIVGGTALLFCSVALANHGAEECPVNFDPTSRFFFPALPGGYLHAPQGLVDCFANTIRSRGYANLGDFEAGQKQCEGTYTDGNNEQRYFQVDFCSFDTTGSYLHCMWSDEPGSGSDWAVGLPHCWIPEYAAFATTDFPNQGPSCPECGNPVNPANGNKFQREVDYVGTGELPLALERIHNSYDAGRRASSLGAVWRHNLGSGLQKDFSDPPVFAGLPNTSQKYSTPQLACESGWAQVKARSIGLVNTTAAYTNGTCTLSEAGTVRGTAAVPNVNQYPSFNPSLKAIKVNRYDGRVYRFTASGNSFIAPAGLAATLASNGTGYQFTEGDTTEDYDNLLRLVAIRRKGQQLTIAYDAQGKRQSVTDSRGRSLTFQYDASNRWSGFTDPDGEQVTYAYDAGNRLTSVTYPDSKTRSYHYEDSGFPFALTGITDENGNRFATWSYDAMGRAATSQHAGGAEATALAYNNDGSTTATDALGAVRTYTFEVIAGVRRANSTVQTCAGCSSASSTTTYGLDGFPASKTDLNGNVTKYVHNSRGLEESRTEAFGTALARTITTQWHATRRLPTQIDEPGRRTTFTYNGDGNRLTHTVTDTATNQSRTTTWTYDAQGRVQTIDGPRTDVIDVTTYAHYTTSSPTHAIGDLHTITNALGHVTEVTAYDAHGNALTIVDPNGVSTTLTYDLRQRLKTRAVDGKTTSFDYDDAGQLIKVTLPDSSFVSYGYDSAHRLTDIEDQAGNTIHYTLDGLGNRTSEAVKDSFGSLKRAQSQVFDTLSRLKEIKNAGSQVVSEFDYDGQGNRISQVDAGLYATTYVPDALNRTKQVIDAGEGSTQYGYNSLDQLTSISDPEGLTTTYTTNAFGDVILQASPDTGSTSYVYDAAGNRTSQIDARGVTVNYTYDKLNRLIFLDYDGIAEDVTYSYDSTVAGNYGVGRLTGILDESGSTSLKYDKRGNVTKEDRVVGEATYSTSYSYDDADRLTGMTYPSGRLVSYVRDNALKQVTKVTTAVYGVTTDVATEIEYAPFGGVSRYRLGNGVAVTRTHDDDYRITEIKDQGATLVQHLDFGYDLRGNVTLRADLAELATDTLGYDPLSRLASVGGGSLGNHGFTYDTVGNRLAQAGASPETYTYVPNTHRLASLGSGTSFGYDAAGNATGKGSLALSYNKANRLAGVTGGTAAVANTYGANGLRATKSVSGLNTLFHYDRQGHLLAEQFDSGLVQQREYIWLGDIPLAQASTRTIQEFIVDNSDSAFSTSGAWSTATAAGQYGANFARRGPAVEAPGESIVDDLDSGASYTGSWLPGTGADCGGLCVPPLGGFVSGEGPFNNTFFRSDTAGTPVFSWQAALPGPGRYRVYVRWVPLTGSGVATYSVAHAAGPTEHTVDQSISSNGWYALGSYEFASAAALITLTPDGGVVAVADAVRLVPIEHTDSDFARWSPSGEEGTYEVLARWPGFAGATAAAPFSVLDAAGSLSITQDQTANTGQWNVLGTFTFDDPVTQGVLLGAVWDENVLADAILFKPVAEYAARHHLAYFHVDHLNTPQKMTDASQSVVWEATYTPFGEATVVKHPFYDNPLRFPGQYFDAETGLHQNWNRDYDPSIGRYLQSDPIGLAGGMSTYGYALQNPTLNTDPSGLLVGPYPPPPPAVLAPPVAAVVATVGAGAALGVGAGLGVNALVEGLTGQSIGSHAYDLLNPACPDSDCPRIIQEINQALGILRGRYADMLVDQHALFINHRRTCDAHPDFGSWDGHRMAYNNAKRWLRRLVDEAAAKGCAIPPEALRWLGIGAPNQPGC